MQIPKKLYRSKTNKIWLGIMGGLGEYFNLDPMLLRLGWVVLVFITGILPGLFAYVIAFFIVPKRPAV